MDEDSTKGAAEAALFAGEAWFDPIEAGLRGRIRGLIEEMIGRSSAPPWGAGATSAAARPVIGMGTASDG
jgi:hypothetical protein